MQPPPAHLKAYLPAVSLRGANDLRAPARRTLLASCLWLDMSGFTPLTERLSAEGPEGIERLSQTLNTLYSTVAGVVAAASGDVMFFAGDGALCLWEAADEASLSEATWQAAGAAWNILDRLAHARSDGHHFEVRQVVVTGELTLDTVGGDQGVWQDVVSGAPLLALPRLGAACGTGHIVLSESAARAIGGGARLHPLPGGIMDLVELQDAPSFSMKSQVLRQARTEVGQAAEAKVPGFLSSQLRQAQLPPSELRRVSIAFSRWKTQDNPGAGELQRLTLALQQVARRHHGWLCQLVQDDKGLTGLTVFGLPGHAQGEDGVRAVRFATEAAQQCKALGLPTSFGVATGSAFCGVRGGQERSQYCVLGNAVNRAARLAEQTLDHPLVDEATFLSAQWRVDFMHHSSLQLKGLLHAVEAYRPGAPRDALLGSSALVAFEAEGDELRGWLSDFAQRGENRPLLVRGQLGAGKTAFLGQLPALCAATGIEVLASLCDELDQHTGYFALRPVMQRLLGDAKNAADVAWLKAALDELGQGEQLALLNPLLLTDFESTPLVQQMSPETRTENRKQLTVNLLRKRLSGRQLVVVVDDAHWLDAASLELVLALRPQLSNLAFVLAERESEAPPSDRLPDARLLAMAPLDVTAVGELIALLAKAPASQPQLSQAICRSARGNPLHCTELVRALLTSGRVEVTPQEVRLKPGSSGDLLELPGTLEELIQARFDRLSSGARDVLRTASVLGTVLDLPVLRQMLASRMSQEALAEALEEVLDVGIVRSRGTHQFEHASIQEVVYRLLLPSEQRQLHERAAHALGSVYASKPELVAARLANHWLRAGNAERAAFFSAMAADQALQGYANIDAEHLFRQAIEQDTAFRGVAAVSMERARWSMLMGQALYSQSRHTEARLANEAAIRWTGTAVPGGAFQLPISISRLVGRALLSKLFRQASRPIHGSAREHQILITRVINAGMDLDAWEGRLFEAANKAIITYLQSRPVSDAPEAAETVAALGYFLASTPARRYSKAQIEQGLREADATGDLQARAATRVLLGMYYTLSGQSEAAVEPLLTARTLAERLGSGLWRHRAWFGLGEALLCSGKLEPAAEAFERSAEIAALAEPPVEGFANCMSALTLSRSGQRERAAGIALGPRGLLLVAGNCLVLQRFTSLGIAAELALSVGRHGQALQLAEEAFELSRARRDVNVFFAALHGHIGTLLTFLGMLERTPATERKQRKLLQERASASLGRLRSFAAMYPAAESALELLRGRYLASVGARGRAQRAFRRALRLAQKSELPFERALALHWTGTLSDAGSARDATNASQALQKEHGIVLDGSAWCRVVEPA
jgi:class 3 adenylate cyclase/tetratricopeptide (TPR) repeat protein